MVLLAAWLACRRSLPLSLMLAMALMTGLGFAAAQLRTRLVAAPVLHGAVSATVRGTVEEVGLAERGPRVVLAVDGIGRMPQSLLPRRVRIVLLPRDPPPDPGSRLSVFARLMPLRAPVSPHAYDFQRAFFFQGIGATGFALSPARIESGPDPGRFEIALKRLRVDLSTRIRAQLSGETGAVAAALLVGDRSGLSEETRQAMRDAGIAHLLAISGLHMGLVAGCVYVVTRVLLSLSAFSALVLPTRRISAVAALLFATFYLLISGLSVPTQRAYIMTAIVFAGLIAGRRAISMRLVALAAFIVMAARPEQVLGASFQLSFAAVLCLVAVYEHGIGGRGRFGGSAFRRLLGGAAMLCLSSLVASLATLPFALHHFHTAAVYGVASNMVAVPLASVWIMPWGVAALALSPFGLEAIGLVPMGWGLDWVIALARDVQQWPHATLSVPAAPVQVLGTISSAGIWLCLWRQRWRFCAVPVITIALASLLTGMWAQPNVLVAEQGGMLGIVENGLQLTERKRGRFVAEVWRRRAGLEGEERGGPGFVCDPLGCMARSPRFGMVVLSRSAQSLEEDCLRADLLVTRIRVKHPCPAPKLVLGPGELKHAGSVVISLDGPKLKMVTSGSVRGQRPWTRNGQSRRRDFNTGVSRN